MSSFRETFEQTEQSIRPRLEKHGFILKKLSVTEEQGTQWVFGSAHYVEDTKWYGLFSKKRFICLSTAPLRFELDLEFGFGKSRCTIYELYRLECDHTFPERKHCLLYTSPSPRD